MIVGVLGGGQLARMLALAGHPMGVRCVFLDPSESPCAASVGRHLRAEFDDDAALDELARTVDCVTLESENVPPEVFERLADQVAAYPRPEALRAAGDRLREKTMFSRLGIPTPAFVAVDDEAGLRQAVKDVGLPAVLKTRRLGYDGKGQVVLRREDQLDDAWRRLGGVPLILEGFVPFDREVSVLAVRGRSADVGFYSLTENVHRDGILRESVNRPGDAMQGRAESYVRLLLDALDYVGVMALELFQVGDELLANEMAPRVHNSGHWTIEGAWVSQFDNHLRAILGWPLGDTASRGRAAMVNYIGALPDVADVLAVPGAHVHLYGKAVRPGRKVGHATVCADDEAGLAERLAGLRTVRLR